MATITLDGHRFQLTFSRFNQFEFDMIIIPEHIEVLSSVYPIDIRDIKKLWRENNYCSMIKLENILKRMFHYGDI